jgi:predicted RecA/RadA family phage recombinase
MKNYVQEGDVLTLTAPTGGVVSGKAYLIGSMLVVAVASASAGAPFEGNLEGVHTLDKASGQAWTEGAKLYWDNTATTATSNTFCGFAAVAAQTADTTGKVLLRQSGI